MLNQTGKGYHPSDTNQGEQDFVLIGECLKALADNRPTGDDSVFDYWPNGLVAVQTAYEVLYADEGPFRIHEYDLHHLDESVGSYLTNRIAERLRDKGTTLLVGLEEELAPAERYPLPAIQEWPQENIEVEE